MASWILSCCIRIHYSLNNGFRSTKFQNWIEVLQYNLGSSGPEMYPRVIKVAWLAIYFSYQEMTIFEIVDKKKDGSLAKLNSFKFVIYCLVLYACLSCHIR